MEGILWIIFLIIINSIFGKKKAGSSPRKPQTSRHKAKPGTKGIEDYFKEIAQRVQEQYQAETQPHGDKINKKDSFQPAREGVPVKAKAVAQKQPAKPATDSMAAVAAIEQDESHPIYGRSQISSGTSLFEKREDIVRGIIYSEILQKPLSIRKKN